MSQEPISLRRATPADAADFARINSHPDLQTAAKTNFEADIDVTIDKVLDCRPVPGNLLHTDTLYFEFYVKDFAKNKSNVITTPEPVYFICR